jgi:hypothetical protein
VGGQIVIKWLRAVAWPINTAISCPNLKCLEVTVSKGIKVYHSEDRTVLAHYFAILESIDIWSDNKDIRDNKKKS